MANSFPLLRNTLKNLRADVDRSFECFLPISGQNGMKIEPWNGFFVGSEPPVIEIEEDNNEIHITAELPGLNRDDFKVELSGDYLVIHGEKQSEREEKKKSYHYSERVYGLFSRSIKIPTEVNINKITSSYKNGVLDLHLPKTEKDKAMRTEIKVS